MVMYVLLRFEDDDIAEEIVKGGYGDTGEDLALVAKPVGLYKGPTKFCECEYNPNESRNRGARYGWMLCKHCNRAVKTMGQNPINILPKQVEEQNDPYYLSHNLSIGPTYWNSMIERMVERRRNRARELIYGPET